jgi:peptidyl-prolyl cis-trans isomerase D
MLLDLRDGIRNSKWLKYLLVTIICIPFALFGINSYFGGGGPDYAAKVNGEKVSLAEYNNAYQIQRNQLRQAFGGRIPEGFDAAGMIGQQAMDTVVTRELLRQTTSNNNMAIGDDALAREIYTSEAFTVDGTFDKERYQLQLQSQGISAGQFEAQYRGDLLLQQLQGSVVDTAFELETEAQLVASLRDQQRTLSTITFPLQQTAESIEVDDAAIQQYYDDNLSNFNNPEKVKIEYLELRPEHLTADLEVTEEQLQEYFELNRREFRSAEQRDASHILLALDSDAGSSEADEVRDKALDLVARIGAGESFEDLAREFSDDPGSGSEGGSLGAFERGVMVPPFEEAVFAMAEGDVSDPVRSDFGYHIIRLNSIIEEQGKSFEDVKDEIDVRYRREQADQRFYDVREQLANASYENSDSLEPAADETGLEIKTSDWIDSNSTDGVGQYRQVLTAALSEAVLNEGQNSEVVEVGDNHVVVLRSVEHEPPAPKTLDEVKDDVTTQLQQQRAREQLDELASQSIDELKDGADAAALADTHSATFTEPAAVGRQGSDADRAVVAELFKMAKPAEGGNSFRQVTTSGGDVAIVIFSGIASQEADDDTQTADGEEEPATPPAPSLAPRAGAAEFAALVGGLQSGAEVEQNDFLLNESGSAY